MNASDSGNDNLRMDDLACAFLAFRETVLAQWRARVTAEIPVAARLGAPILVDMLPTLYDNIAEALSSDAPRPTAVSKTTLASSHGRERANLTDYGPQDLIHELQIFRDVLFSVVKANGLYLDKHGGDIIGHSIEEVTREAVAGYAMTNMEVSESFVSTLSHDLRNPLHIASASAQLIQLKTTDPGLLNLARRIARKLTEADEMIQTLLDAAMLKSRMKIKLNIMNFEFMELVEEVCADLPMTGQPVDVQGEHVRGYWCRVSMKRVLENLLSNAQKYGDGSKPIVVHVARVGERMQLSVHNHGAPIPEDELKRMFNTFARLEDVKVKGWGLGLPFVQNIAESHGGSVVADSEASRGTTFTVSVPVDARPYADA